MFPPSLYNYITESLNKEMILVLNKIDLAPAPLVVAWMYHFKENYPSLKIITFTSYPSYNLRNFKNSSGMSNVICVIVVLHQIKLFCYLRTPDSIKTRKNAHGS